jgi:hypothetical protein
MTDPEHTQPAPAPKSVTIASLFYWPEKTGIAPPVQQLADMLVEHGSQVTVLAPRPSYPEMAVFPNYRDGSRDRETHNGVSIVRFPVAPQKDLTPTPASERTIRDVAFQDLTPVSLQEPFNCRI